MFMRTIRRAADLKNVLVVNFLCLMINLFLVVMQINQGFWPPETFFQPVLLKKDKYSMMKTLEVFVDTLEKHDLTYFMYGGTMLGSYRHHGPIPWDDDIDLMLNSSQKRKIIKKIKKLEPQFSLYHQSDGMESSPWKFYSNDAATFLHRPFAWPYIDIFFFKENETHLWDEIPKYGNVFKFAKSLTLPLRKRPFGYLSLYAPCNPLSALTTGYDTYHCKTRSFSHISEFPIFNFNKKELPCRKLQDKFPFVFRSMSPDGLLNETLMIAGWKIHSKSLPSMCGISSDHLKQQLSSEFNDSDD